MIAGNEIRGGNGPKLFVTNSNSRNSNPISIAVPWLLTTKVTAPARMPFYIDRPQLIERIERIGCPIVVLRAPGGFGKTTLLSEIFHFERERGNLAAWLTLDENDTREGVELYLTYAFERAGLQVAAPSDTDEYGLEQLAHEIESGGEDCLVVIDEVERLEQDAVDTLDYFLHRIPDNLRVVLGLRNNPGLDLSAAVLEGRAIVVGAEELRFSKSETDTFFDGSLSSRQLAAVIEHTRGWPVALGFCRIMRNDLERPIAIDELLENLADDEGSAVNWLGTRLLRNIREDDREFLLDLAQFDWIEPAMVDDALGRNDTGHRLVELAALRGLLHQLGTGTDRWQLHPLLKEVCGIERRRENPDRYLELHRAIAAAMIERGHLLLAVRHASEARDWDLVGDALLQAGGLRLWLREGMTRLGAAERFLTDEVVKRFPRLELLRCRLLVHRSRLIEARARYENVRTRTDDFAHDRPGGDDSALRAEATIVRAGLTGFGCMPFDKGIVQELIDCLAHVRGEESPDPETVGAIATFLVAAYDQGAQFERGRAFGAEAEAQFLLCNSVHGTMHLALIEGIGAMAQGRSAEAENHYARAASIAEQHFPLDANVTQTVRVLTAELDVECGRTPLPREGAQRIPVPFRNIAAWLDVYAAANELAVESRFDSAGAEEALNVVEASCDWADSQGLVSVSRHLLTLKIGYLAEAGRVDEAAATWLDAAFPDDIQSILDLDRYTWREIEAISCARLRLLVASGELESARELAGRLSALARDRNLMRTLTRSLALSMILEYRANDTDAAMAHLVEYVNVHAETGFAGAMVRAHATSRPLLGRLLRTGLERRLKDAAQTLLRKIDSREGSTFPDFTVREREILELLARSRRDKEIARLLGLSVDGVRYHLRNIYRKLGVSRRGEAVSRARTAGIVS